MIIATNKGHRLLNLLILSVPDEGYSRNAPCALNLISTCLFLFLFITVNMNNKYNTKRKNLMGQLVEMCTSTKPLQIKTK